MDITLPQQVVPALILVLTAIGTDFVLGVLVAIKKKELDADKLPRFFITGVIPYAGGLVVLAISAELVGQVYQEMFFAVAAPIAVKYLANIMNKLADLFAVRL